MVESRVMHDSEPNKTEDTSIVNVSNGLPQPNRRGSSEDTVPCYMSGYQEVDPEDYNLLSWCPDHLDRRRDASERRLRMFVNTATHTMIL